MSTSADLWCHVLGEGEQALLVRVPRLRQFLQGGGFRSVHTGGADSNSRGLLVPRAALEGPDFGWIVLPTVEDYFGAVFRQATSTVERGLSSEPAAGPRRPGSNPPHG